jgi:hypothetical protein
MSITSQRYIANFEPAPPVLVTQSRATFQGMEMAEMLEIHKISSLVSAQPSFLGKIHYLEAQVTQMTKATKCRAYMRRLEHSHPSLVRPLEGSTVEVLPFKKSVFGTVVSSGDVVYMESVANVEETGYDHEIDLSADLIEGETAQLLPDEGCLLAVPILAMGTGEYAYEATANLHIVGVLETYGTVPVPEVVTASPY